MPTYRSINIALHSQFHVEPLREYHPPPQPCESFREGTTASVPNLIDEKSSTCSVHVPVVPGSQFWISYSVSPPVPEDQLFVFKLFVNGSHIVTWSTGKKDEWKGKTMFALYERRADERIKRIEKRVLCFTAPDQKDGVWKDVTDPLDKSAYMEIRVHRASGRKRVERIIDAFGLTPHAKNEKGISLINAGRAGADNPKRFYQFALVDPIDSPFATFRYYYRTREQIQRLGLMHNHLDSKDSVEENEMSIIEPQEPGKAHQSPGRAPSPFLREQSPFTPLLSPRVQSPATQPNVPVVYIPRGAPGMLSRQSHETLTEHIPWNCCPPGADPRSFSPSTYPNITFQDSSRKPLPTPPPKRCSSSAASCPIDATEGRLVSPSNLVSPARSGYSNQSSKTGRSFTVSSIVNAITGKWKRRGSPLSPTPGS